MNSKENMQSKSRLSKVFWLWSLFLGWNLVWAKGQWELDLKKAQSIIENELVYPGKIYGVLRYPPVLESQKKLLKEWIKSGLVSENNQEIKVISTGPQLEIIRDYPRYKISGLKVPLCQMGIKVEKIRSLKDGVEVVGKKTVIEKTVFMKDHGALEYVGLAEKESMCVETKVKWIVRKVEGTHVVEEIHG